MERSTSIHYKKVTPEGSAYPCFIEFGRKDKAYTIHDIAAMLIKRTEAMLANPNVVELRIGVMLEEVLHDAQIVDAASDEQKQQ